MPKRSQKARDVYLMGQPSHFETNATSGQYATLNKLLPKTHTDFRRVLAHLNAEYEAMVKENGGQLPKGVSSVNLLVFRTLLTIATRDPVENKIVECECGIKHEVPVQSALLEKNSMQALLKLSDKLAPNLAAVTQDINVNIIVQNISAFVVKVITRYVPGDERPEVLSELNQVMTEVASGEA